MPEDMVVFLAHLTHHAHVFMLLKVSKFVIFAASFDSRPLSTSYVICLRQLIINNQMAQEWKEANLELA